MSKPERILQVVTHMNRGGLETMIMNYYRNIDRNRIQFDFLTHRPESEKKDYDWEIKSLGGKIYHISRLNPFSLKYYKELRMFFLSHPEYKIIHVHQDCMSSVVLKVAKKCGIQVRIAHCHSSNQDHNLYYPIKLFFKMQISKYATRMISCGKKAGEWMFGKNADFTVLPNAIDTERFVFSEEKRDIIRNQLELKPTDIVIGHVGRFSLVKNQEFLIEIINELVSINNNFKLVLVGTGERLPIVRKKVEDYDLLDNVLFLGLREDVNDLLQAFDIFVMPSLYEGLPVSIIEAQAAGLKCVISDKVPIDCDVTGSIIQIPLDSTCKEWSDLIIKNIQYERVNSIEIIKRSGFDIKENVNLLSKIYSMRVGNKYYEL